MAIETDDVTAVKSETDDLTILSCDLCGHEEEVQHKVFDTTQGYMMWVLEQMEQFAKSHKCKVN